MSDKYLKRKKKMLNKFLTKKKRKLFQIKQSGKTSKGTSEEEAKRL